jgi:hypothetical protein
VRMNYREEKLVGKVWSAQRNWSFLCGFGRIGVRFATGERNKLGTFTALVIIEIAFRQLRINLNRNCHNKS